MRGSRRRHAWLRMACALLAAGTLAACEVPAPEGAAPLRYRDAVFPAVKETADLQYGEAPGPGGEPQQLRLDVYEPAGDTARRRPAVIWMHGGGFRYGSRKDPMMTELARRFARRGFVAVSIGYRLLADEACGGEASVGRCVPAVMAAADDERAAIRYLRRRAAELRIDPDRIAIGGASAGGVASVLAGATPTSPGSSGNPGWSSAAQVVVSISGGLPFEGVFDPGDPPVLFWQGTDDTVVPYAWAYSNASFMLQRGMIAVLRDVRGAGHVPSSHLDDMDEQARNFIYRVMYLQLAEGGPGA